MRAAIALWVGLLGCAAHRSVATMEAPSPPGDASALTLALADEYLARYYAEHPELATLHGWPAADHGAVSDVTAPGRARWRRQVDEVARRLHAIDPTALTERARLTRALVLEEAEASRALRTCRSELWDVRASVWPWQSLAVLVAGAQLNQWRPS